MLVSAGAGSGKTSVLTERLVRMLSDGDSLDDFLVVTFTNAAAADLKDKLYDKLSKASAADPANKHIYNQLFLLSGARISTIHSFCYELVKHNFNTLGISADCRVIDDTECRTLLSDTMSDLFDDLFTASDKSALLLLDRLCPGGTEAQLASVITEVYDRIRAFYRYDEWLSSCAAHYRKEASKAAVDLFATDCGIELHDEIVREAKEFYIEACEFDETLASAPEKNRRLPQAIRELLARIIDSGTYTALKDALSVQLPRANTSGLDDSAKEYYDTEKEQLTDFIKSIKGFMSFESDDFAKLFSDSADVADALSDIVLQLDSRFFKAKQKRGGVDFADLEQLTLKLLENENGEPTEICLGLRASFKQVFVDEYQDVNPLQDRIFRLLSRDDDRFTVGDTKQSIYRFRNAYPSIFIGYKTSYGDFETGVKNAVIFLRENFRCAKSIIDFTNAVTEYASADSELEDEYKGEALVHCRGGEDPNIPVTLALCDYEKGSETDNDRTEAIDKCARYIASEIKRLSDLGTPYSDMALLFSAIKGASYPFEKALSDAGIPYRVMRSSGLLTAPEVTLALCCLAAIDNPTDDVSLFSMMRSPMFGFTADELYKIRQSNDAYSFITCIRRYAHGMHLRRVRVPHAVYRLVSVSDKTARPESKAAKFLKRLDFYRTAAGGMQAHKFLWMLYETSGLLSAAAAEGARQKANLLRLYQDAAAFESRGFRGVSAFRAYTERLIDEGADIAGAQISDDDCVKLMTVHASKGLEYPVCFYVSADREFNTKDSKATLLIAHKSGISFMLNYPETMQSCDTPSRRLSAYKVAGEARAEELRKLYVALTRAKDRLYVVACRRIGYDYAAVKPSEAKKALEWILGALEGRNLECVRRVDISDDISLSHAEHDEDIAYAFDEGVEKRIAFRYPFSASSDMPAKISVSQLDANGNVSESGAHRTPSFVAVNANQKGTADHMFMQFCDMAAASSKGAAAEADRLEAMRFITREQREMLDISALDRFFRGSLYAEMSASEHIYRERRFSLTDDGALIGGVAGEEILVQGVIDCFYTTPRGLVIVDYKTDRVFGDTAEAELVKRHGAQIRYYAVAAERMTDIKVCRAVIYSFALGREVEVPLD